MSWFELIKNQKTIAGLNMRSMDLDNIIEDDDDDCETRFLSFIKGVESLGYNNTNSLRLPDNQKVAGRILTNTPAPFLEEEYCWLLAKLKERASVEEVPVGRFRFESQENLMDYRENKGDVRFVERRYHLVDTQMYVFYYTLQHQNNGYYLRLIGKEGSDILNFIKRYV